MVMGDQGDQARAGRGQQDPDRTDRQDTYAGQRHDTSDPEVEHDPRAQRKTQEQVKVRELRLHG